MTDNTPDHELPDDLPDDLDLDEEEMLADEDEEDPGPPHPVNWYLSLIHI